MKRHRKTAEVALQKLGKRLCDVIKSIERPSGYRRERYFLVSPDGEQIGNEPFATRKDAAKMAVSWCRKFKKQGYYLTLNGEKISLQDLPSQISIERYNLETAKPISNENLHMVKEIVRKQWEEEQRAKGVELPIPTTVKKLKRKASTT